MSRKTPPAETPPPPAPTSPQPPAPDVMPRQGGRWQREADGTLTELPLNHT